LVRFDLTYIKPFKGLFIKEDSDKKDKCKNEADFYNHREPFSFFKVRERELVLRRSPRSLRADKAEKKFGMNLRLLMFLISEGVSLCVEDFDFEPWVVMTFLVPLPFFTFTVVFLQLRLPLITLVCDSDE
jgi:hypothetical protein